MGTNEGVARDLGAQQKLFLWAEMTSPMTCYAPATTNLVAFNALLGQPLDMLIKSHNFGLSKSVVAKAQTPWGSFKSWSRWSCDTKLLTVVLHIDTN